MSDNKILTIFKSIYSKNGYIFLSVNVFSFIIIFFILNEEIGGSIFMRIFAFLFCSIIGGLLGVWWLRNKEDGIVSGFRGGAGWFLLIFTLLMWSNNNYVSPYRSSSKTYSTQSYTCPHCDGAGSRTNNITGQYGDCSSCGGNGKVTEEQYNSLSK